MLTGGLAAVLGLELTLNAVWTALPAARLRVGRSFSKLDPNAYELDGVSDSPALQRALTRGAGACGWACGWANAATAFLARRKRQTDDQDHADHDDVRAPRTTKETSEGASVVVVLALVMSWSWSPMPCSARERAWRRLLPTPAFPVYLPVPEVVEWEWEGQESSGSAARLLASAQQKQTRAPLRSALPGSRAAGQLVAEIGPFSELVANRGSFLTLAHSHLGDDAHDAENASDHKASREHDKPIQKAMSRCTWPSTLTTGQRARARQRRVHRQRCRRCGRPRRHLRSHLAGLDTLMNR
jgi:hypothetical protein